MGVLDNFLSLFKPDGDENDFMTVPGDKISAEITKTNRRVTKMSRADGSKYSRTDYSNGTSVETRTFKKKK